MPDTGAPWNIPYVAGTDLVADWPTDNQTQAEAIASALGVAGIAQIVTATKTDTQTESSVTAGGTFAVTGLSATITPTSASNNVLVFVQVAQGNAIDIPVGVIVKRGSTAIGVGDTAGNRTPVTIMAVTNDGRLGSGSVALIDSPATTSATTYSVDLINPRSSALTIYVNRGSTDTDNTYITRAASHLVLAEVYV